MEQINGRSIIAGLVCEKSETVFRVSNPVTNELLQPVYYEASLSDIDKAVNIATSI